MREAREAEPECRGPKGLLLPVLALKVGGATRQGMRARQLFKAENSKDIDFSQNLRKGMLHC